MSKRVVLVDPHQLFRQGLQALIEQSGGLYAVVGHAEDGHSAMQAVESHSPDVVIAESTLKDMPTSELAQKILKQRPEVRMVVLSSRNEQRLLQTLLKAGTAGFLLKTCSQADLMEALQAVSGGQVYICQRMRQAQPGSQTSLEPANAFDVLSERERQVLQLVSEGYSTKEIAGKLQISVKTIDTHRQHIMDKLDIHGVADLTRYALKQGLSSLDE